MTPSLSELENLIQSRIEGQRPSPDVLATHRRVHTLPEDLYLSDANLHLMENSVVFVADCPTYNVVRRSCAIRDMGLRTTLVTRWGLEPTGRQFFDHVFLFDHFDDLVHLRRSRERVLHVTGGLGWNFLPVYLKHLTNKPILCDIPELAHTLISEPELRFRRHLSQHDLNIELECERTIFDHFELVTIPYLKRSLRETLGHNTLNLSEQVLHFPSYPSRAFFHDFPPPTLNDPIGLLVVCDGAVAPPPYSTHIQTDARSPIWTLREGGLEVRMLHRIDNGETHEPLTPRDLCAQPHLARDGAVPFSGLAPWKLRRLDHRCHFGAMINTVDDAIDTPNAHVSAVIPEAVFTYLELGLPIIASDDMLAVSSVVDRYDLGVTIASTDLVSIREHLLHLGERYEGMLRAIELFREEYAMEVMMPMLLDRIDRAVRG